MRAPALFLCAAASLAGTAVSQPAWSYNPKAPNGPGSWKALKHDWFTCGHGKAQSPIDIASVVPNKDLPRLQFDMDDEAVTLENNGHYLVWHQHGVTRFGEREFNLTGITFHAPSEHKVRGISFPLEAQLVHKHAGGDVDLVVSVLFVNGRPNRSLRTFWNKLPRHLGEFRTVHHDASAEGILPADRNYFYYSGSQTKPPCRENVQHIVLTDHPSVGEGQVDAYHALFGRSNSRPTQPLSGRKVQASVGLKRTNLGAEEGPDEK